MVKILDSTLREGEQTPGIYFSPDEKLLIAQFLDQIGIDIIEVGNPVVDGEITLAITKIAKAGLNAKIGAHSLCRIDNVQKAIDCGVDFLGVFFSVSPQRLYRDYNISLEKAIDRIVEVITYARKQKNDLLIRYTPEDTVRSPIENVISAASEAVKAGANIISIADTTGYTNPFHPQRNIYNYVKTLKDELEKRDLYPQIAVHCHNDKGLALANALDAYRAGADIIDVSVMGLGERAGIVDLAELLINLIDMNDEVNSWQLNYLKDLYDFVSEHSHISIPPHQAITGKNAFTHYAGVHVKAVAKDERLYQSLSPDILGIKSSLALGMQSGITAVELAIKQIGREDLAKNKDLVAKILQEIKVISKRGTPIDIDKELPEIIERCTIKPMMTSS
ncbi:2-isopropylmalate synthase [Anabaena cylindrica FACHB-243]|uniref:Homocitrate synthase n=1 Tax=Anabaena cylindrica (strain ATCC 27899 / PCC 7122) TaxID=272123 RepID=K9ZGM5_ANACC|nr:MULTISPECIES: homocitrate synthase [Anabaena]AFZ57914.1 homocitrate synthase [Anabaena cylindrica PCC 7122]MBD2419731.1 2-isopropylmalate synthase [Anabaena cylindrica FACHB-243]MBY5281566.1 2-isopropylmalate synthase [Anabaena sp. CCAP 1446/1C]MBY5307181.1 2-isopropylmalate synthase [Anabaena sp. CCAP 1446/1C]MCM2405544.1 2-isopropylmalate synthase [Anabaena sp. CCAP 1446/1C]